MKTILSLLFCSLFTSLTIAQNQDTIVQEVLNDYVDSLGGMYMVDSITSIELAGTLSIEERSWPFTMWKRLPNLARLTVEQKQGNLVRMFDGEKALQKLPFEQDATEFRGVGKTHFLMLSSMTTPLWEASLKGWMIKHKGVDILRGNTCDVLEYTDPRFGLVRCYMEQFRSVPLRIDVREAGKPEDTPFIVISFTNYKRLGDQFLPFTFIVLENNIKHTYGIESYEVNTGVIPTIFNAEDAGGAESEEE